jgi:hypothetical protein
METHPTQVDEGSAIHIRAGEGGLVVAVAVDRDADGGLMIVLSGVDCNLEGEMPGVYYPTPRT